MIILAQGLRHNMSDAAIGDNLDVIDYHLPHPEYRSKYRFLKKFKIPTFVEHYYCYNCSVELTFVKNTTVCQKCNKEYKKQY